MVPRAADWVDEDVSGLCHVHPVSIAATAMLNCLVAASYCRTVATKGQQIDDSTAKNLPKVLPKSIRIHRKRRMFSLFGVSKQTNI